MQCLWKSKLGRLHPFEEFKDIQEKQEIIHKQDPIDKRDITDTKDDIHIKWYDNQEYEHIITKTHLSGGRFLCNYVVRSIKDIDISPIVLPFNIAKVVSFDD